MGSWFPCGLPDVTKDDANEPAAPRNKFVTSKEDEEQTMYKQKTRGWSQHMDFMAFDMLALEISLLISCFLHFDISEMINRRLFWGCIIFVPFVDLTVMVVMDVYHGVIRRDSYHELTKLLNQTVYIALIFGAFLILSQANASDTPYMFFITVLIYIVLSFTIRCTWKSHLQKRLHLKNHTGLLVVAGVDRIHEVVSSLINHNYSSYRFVGVALLNEKDSPEEGQKALEHIKMGSTEVTGLEIVASRKDLLNYLVKNWVDEIFIDVPSVIPMDLINQIMSMGITVHMALNDIDKIIARHKNIEWICGQATITASLGYISGRDLFLKRLMDIFFGFFGCLATLIITIFVGPLIYIASPGPIFFHQTRIGENGRKFKMYKFRSMYPDAEARKKALQASGQDNLMFKMEHDPRIIGMKQRKDGSWSKGIGGWIRDLSLDEFPQFFNILKGDMSLVGTRPPTVDEWTHYKPAYRARMSTKPGLTGLWQVSGRSTIKDFEKVVQLDREYIENWSLKLDLQILHRTIWVVLTRHGAM